MKQTILKFLSMLLTLCTLLSTFGGGMLTVHAADAGAGDATAGDKTAGEDAASGDAEEEEIITAETLLIERTYSSPAEKLSSMELVLDAADSFGYRLYALELTGEVAVEDVKTGQILFTNPFDAGKASTMDKTRNEMLSQLHVNYKDTTGKVSTLYSYADAAMSEQIVMHTVKNGIRMDYTVGRSDARRLCPLSIEKSRYEEVLLAYIDEGKTDGNDYKKFRSYYTLYDPFTEESEAVKESWKDQYPITAEMAIYVMAESSTNYEKNNVERMIKAWCPHYTFEDLQNDHEMTKFTAKSTVMPVFKMSLEYKLDKQGLTVRLPANSVSFNEDYYTLNSIAILPYFGAGSSDYTGYTFVPDGSGSIIRFEDIKDTTWLFTGDMYGPDYSYQTLGSSFTGKAQIMRLPVFGLVENRGYFYKLDENGAQTDELYCAHNNKDEIEKVPHTCTEDGYTRYACSSCGEEILVPTIDEKKDPAAHTFVEKDAVVTEPTCTEQGYTTNTCTVCGETVQTDFVKASHKYEKVVTPSGCAGTARGYTTNTCSVCGDSYRDKYTDPGHNYKEVQVEGVSKKANCKTGETGTAVMRCDKKDCPDPEHTVTLYPVHTWKNTKANKNIKVNGQTFVVYNQECTVCGAKATTVDHNSTTVQGQPADYEHVIGNSNREVVAEATCFSYGLVKGTGVCRRCGMDVGEILMLIEPSHNFTDTVLEATCTEGGYTDRVCADCGYSVREKFTEAAHKYEKTKVEPSCTTCGYTEYVCAACGDSYRDTWTSAGHDWDYGITDIEGNTFYTCSECLSVTHNGAFAEATRHRGNKIDSEQPLPKEEDFEGMDAPPIGGDTTSGDAVSGDAVSGEAASGEATSGEAASGEATSGAASGDVTSGATSGGAASGDATSGAASGDAASGDTGKVESDLTVPDGAYVKYIPRGFLAVVEDGESLSTVTSYHGGTLHKYNSVYLSVNPRPSDQYNLRDSLSVGEDAPWTVVSKRKYTGSYRLRIIMIGEGTGYEASYSGMANAYRQYLKDTGALTPLTADGRGVPLTLTMRGLTSEEVSFLGVPYWDDRAMTTFEDLKAITEDLAGEGITNLNYTLWDWTEEADLPDNLEYRDVVGGDKGYRDFASYAEEKKIGLYPEFSFAYGFGTGMFSGIRMSRHAAKTIDDRYIIKRTYDPVLQILSFGDDDQAIGFSMSASAFDYFYSLIVGDLTDLGYLGIAPRNLGSDVNSDFDEDEPYNREDSKAFVTELLAKMKEDSGDRLLLEGGNAYVLPYVRNLLNVSLEGSNYLNTSASVPFTGMVLHGYVNYSGDYTNEASDSRRETLKMIENGAYPSFFLAKRNTKLIVGSNQYSISYDSWREDMIEIYGTVNKALKDLQTTEFVKHEILVGERVPEEEELARDKITGEEELAKAEEKVEATRTAYINAVELYKRLIDAGSVYYAELVYRNAAVTAPKAYKDALAALEKAKATYGERVSDYDADGNYITTRYTVNDGSIVRVTYANGVSYLLNYNNFPVKVNIDGKSYTVPAFDYLNA